VNARDLNQEVFDLTLFFLTAARGCVSEPHMYGPLRLVDGASRVIALTQREGSVPDSFLVEVKKVIDEKKFLVMSSENEFVSFIDQLISRCVDEMKKRRGR